MKFTTTLFATLLLATLAAVHAADAPDKLDSFWPFQSSQRGWRLVDHADRSKHMMTITHTKVDDATFRMWFSDKPGQKPGQVDIEQFRHVENTGGEPWLWLDKYIDCNRDSGSWVEHSVQSSKILFTPADGVTRDLIADGTYERGGGRGQPYLLVDQSHSPYRIQVWGTIDRDTYPNSNWQWYWDATVFAAEDVRNDCLPSQKAVKAIKVKEAWWCNFSGTGVWSGGVGGSIGTNGLPTGEKVVPFRTVWHAEGHLPYFVIGTTSEAPNWCTSDIWNVKPEPREDPERKRASSNAAITVAAGGLPIILTAPHGGSAAISGVPERKGEGVAKFVAKTDSNTDVLTEKLADALEQKTGKRPYVAIARFHRKYLDANRSPKEAFEVPEAKATYDAYHAAISSACKEVTARWGRGVVLDVHGQASEPGAIMRGTQNGETVANLIGRFGRDSVNGETSLFGELAKQGFTVLPPVGSSDPETKYSGGHTVGIHGSSSGGTIDAIQLELGTKYRDAKVVGDVADKLATAIAAFAKSHLPTEEQKRTGKISVGVYLDEGAGPSVNELLRTLEKFEQVAVTKLTAEQIRSGGLAGLDILMCPGGSGGTQGRNLDEPGREKIRGFVREGGGYVGICAGAYLATAHYTWSLNILDAKVIDTKHWNRGKGTVDIELTPAGRELLRAPQARLPIHYAQGPLMAPANKPEIEDYDELATFKTEIAQNGAPSGVMTGTTAIARGRFGQGRVICFSPHPEMTAGLEAFVQDAINHVNRSGKFQ